MKIAIDVHGTLSNWPLFWNKALAMLQAMGIKIYVLSGPEKEKIIGRLIALNIDTKWFEGILSVADWIKEQKGATFWYDDNNEFWTDEKTWNEAKAYICAVNMIEVLIDDQIEYFHPDIAPHTLFVRFNKILGFKRITDEKDVR